MDLNHVFHQFDITDKSKKLFVFYKLWCLYCYNSLVIGVSSASSECHKRMRRMVKGLEGVQQIKVMLSFIVKGKSMIGCSRYFD